MNALVVYDSQFGNTERIARAVAAGLGSTRLVTVRQARALVPLDFDLIVVGGPTQLHGPTLAMRALFDGMVRGSLRHLPAAAFDTRYHMARLLSGSAARWIAGRLERLGAELILAPESFFVARDVPPPGENRRHDLELLEPGEEDRAGAWARWLLECLGATQELQPLALSR